MQAAFALGEDMVGDLGASLARVRPLVERKAGGAKADEELIKVLIEGVGEHRERALAEIEQLLDVPRETVGRIEQVAMLMAAVEMRCRPDTPRAVVINEWLEISKQYGAEGGHRLVNVVLDRVGAG